jgi:hypothetical protein
MEVLVHCADDDLLPGTTRSVPRAPPVARSCQIAAIGASSPLDRRFRFSMAAV